MDGGGCWGVGGGGIASRGKFVPFFFFLEINYNPPPPLLSPPISYGGGGIASRWKFVPVFSSWK